jgi:hypothetical protein
MRALSFLVTAVAIVAVLSALSACGSAPKPAPASIKDEVRPVTPVPPPPVAWNGVAGALPPSFHYLYNDHYRGWPVAPLHRAHPIISGFLDPRELAGYHFGVDIPVDDLFPEQGAPAGGSQRVYALEAGKALVRTHRRVVSCSNRHIRIGHFEYWHIIPTVRFGQQIKAGQPVGWTCLGSWHIHISEWQLFRHHLIWVNPLRGGRLGPLPAGAKPQIGALRLYTRQHQRWCPTVSLSESDDSARLSPDRLHGKVELRAEVSVPENENGYPPISPTEPAVVPYRIEVVVDELANGRQTLVFDNTAFQADTLPSVPYLVFFAPGTQQQLPRNFCLFESRSDCQGHYWLRPFSGLEQRYWDTRHVPDGHYRITLTAWSVTGRATSRSLDVVVANKQLVGRGPELVPASLPPCWGNLGFRAWAETHGLQVRGGEALSSHHSKRTPVLALTATPR